MSIRNIMNLVNTTMPYVWDDSLSVYEMLGKMINTINEAVDLVNRKLPDDFEKAFYAKFREYTREEMQRIIDSGEFATILDSMVAEFLPIKQEVIDARDGELSLGAKIRSVDDKIAIDNFSATQFLEMPENYLELPSALENSLATHPSVIDFGFKWNGYRYWMAYTPYPGTKNENPSIAASNDNKTWVLPEGAPNPIVPAPLAPSYNSDTELVYISAQNKLRMYYREYNDNISNLYSVESSDGVAWTTPTLNFSTSDLLLSPSIIIDSGLYKMWSVEGDRKISYRTSTNGISWTPPTLINQPHSFWSLWHIGISKDSTGKYHMMASTYPNSGSGEGTQYRPIVYASSNDGINWIPNEKPQMIPTGWAGGYLYRPTFIVDETKPLQDGLPYIKMWFSASGDITAADWHIGYVEGYIMTGDTNPSATSDNMKRKRVGEYFKLFASNIVAPFAKIARIRTKRIEISSDYSQPLVELRDGRVDRNGGNYARIEYLGGDDPSIIRFRLIFTDNEGNTKLISVNPFLNALALPNYDITGVKQLHVDEIINRDGIRSYMNSSAYNRIVTNVSGELEFQLNARGTNKKWTFRSVSGMLDAGENTLVNLRYLNIKGATAISSAPNGTLFEDADGKLKYKNQDGVLTVLT